MKSSKHPSVFTDFETDAYDYWRDQKLRKIKTDLAEHRVLSIQNPLALSDTELQSIADSINVYGFVIYDLKDNTSAFSATDLRAMCSQLGLNRINKNRCAYEDGVTRLQLDSREERHHYIPYTNKPLKWHTDGYYNSEGEQIKSFVLHCVRDAKSGGDSYFFDNELLYLLIRDKNPEWVKNLFSKDILSIPENNLKIQNIRPEQQGPVFWIDDKSGGLQVRYTARTSSVRWKADMKTAQSVAFIRKVLEESEFIENYKLRSGQGVISNNCLHGRTAFIDNKQLAGSGRLLYRARFFNRITIPGK